MRAAPGEETVELTLEVEPAAPPDECEEFWTWTDGVATEVVLPAKSS